MNNSLPRIPSMFWRGRRYTRRPRPLSTTRTMPPPAATRKPCWATRSSTTRPCCPPCCPSPPKASWRRAGIQARASGISARSSSDSPRPALPPRPVTSWVKSPRDGGNMTRRSHTTSNASTSPRREILPRGLGMGWRPRLSPRATMTMPAVRSSVFRPVIRNPALRRGPGTFAGWWGSVKSNGMPRPWTWRRA